MPRGSFGWPPRGWVRGRSSVCALLAALLLHVALVVLLLHIPLHIELGDRPRPTAAGLAPRQSVVYMTLSPANQVFPAADRPTKSRHTTSATSDISQPRQPAVIEAVAAPTDTLAGTVKSSQKTSVFGFRTLRPDPVARSQAEVIDSIIRGAIQPGNDSAGRVRLAIRTAVDWTVAVNGARYGLSPGQLHVGKIWVPLPLVFGEPLSLSGRQREFRRMIQETRSQAARAARHAAFDSAVASIRLQRLTGERPGSHILEPEPK